MISKTTFNTQETRSLSPEEVALRKELKRKCLGFLTSLPDNRPSALTSAVPRRGRREHPILPPAVLPPQAQEPRRITLSNNFWHLS